MAGVGGVILCFLVVVVVICCCSLVIGLVRCCGFCLCGSCSSSSAVAVVHVPQAPQKQFIYFDSKPNNELSSV